MVNMPCYFFSRLFNIICLLAVERMVEMGWSVLKKNKVSDLEDVR